MALKHYNPTTPSQRQLVTVDRSELWKGKPVKKLTRGMAKSGGRNNTGRVTMWHRGGGHKRRYRIVDFHRKKFDIPAVVERLEYDPNRTAFIALINYEDGEQSYIIAPQRLNVGDRVVAAEQADVKPGNAMPLKNIPVGTIIHNVELKAGKGGQIARSAGTTIRYTCPSPPLALCSWLTRFPRRAATRNSRTCVLPGRHYPRRRARNWTDVWPINPTKLLIQLTAFLPITSRKRDRRTFTIRLCARTR